MNEQSNKEWREGDRVRMVHRPSFGVICGPVEASPEYGTPRFPVRWESTGGVTRWDPAFLVPADQPISADPSVVVGSEMRSCAADALILDTDTVAVRPVRFERISPHE